MFRNRRYNEAQFAFFYEELVKKKVELKMKKDIHWDLNLTEYYIMQYCMQ